MSTSLLRYWEKEFGYLRPKKNSRGDRQYTEKDIKVVAKIHQLVKVNGYTLEGAKKELKNSKSKAKSNVLAIAKLTELRTKLLKIKARL